MNTQDEAAWDREFDHVESKQKQREGWDGRQPAIEIISVSQFKEMVEQVNEK